jgi:nucleotide-binding universal stress UspA family protein
MADLSRILVPVDFSPRCLGAVQYAEALASYYQSKLFLLHVLIPPMVPYATAEAMLYSGVVDLSAEMLVERRQMLDEFMVEELKNVPVERVLLQGDPAREIADYATKENCGLIVMPTHGHGPFRRFLLGSVTAKVLHDAPCPVWTGPHMEQAPPHERIQFRKILCALDLGLQSRMVLCWAAQFAREFGAALSIVHVIPIGTVRLGGFYFDPEWRLELSRRAREQIADLKDDLQVEAEELIETGEVAAAVSDAARQCQADLIAIGRGHSTGGPGRLRAHAYAILRESPCPVTAI